MIKLRDILKEVVTGHKVYCDLDGVLVDFRRGYKDLTGHEPPPAESQIDKKAFWEPIDKSGGDFWANLHWTNDGKALWKYLTPYNPEILSSPSDSQSSVVGKKRWVEEHIPGTKLNLVQSKQKQIKAEPGAILIDDRGDICDRWEAAGGIAIHHTSALETIKKLKEILGTGELNEAKQVGTLYHFTNYASMIGIINSNFVLTTRLIEIQPYVSFTRNKALNPDSISTDTRITVDGNGLSNRYQIMPHADVMAGYGRTSVDESEERISLIKYPKGVDVSKYITAIDIKKPNYEADYDDEESYGPPSLLSYEELIKTLKSKNIDYNLVDKYK